jgi:hypothetical protein
MKLLGKYYLAGIVSLFLTVNVQAQAPEGMSYQAVLRDVSGVPIQNQGVTVIFEIRQGGPTGADVYKESQGLTTNQFGLINANIGAGTVLGGAFNTISWGTDVYYLYVEVDGDPLGSTQLLSVPYALYSKESANGPTGAQGPPGIGITWLGSFSAPPPTPTLNDAYYNSSSGQSFIWNGSAWSVIAQDGTAGGFIAGPGIDLTGTTISNTGDLDALNELQTIATSGLTAPSIDLSNGGGSISLVGTGGTSISETGNVITINSADSVNDADNDPSNEIQMITSAAGTISLSNGGGSVTDLVDDADNDPNNERITTFTVNGTNDSLIIVEAGVGHAMPLSDLSDGDWIKGAGNISNTIDYVGVGIASPAQKLHVYSSGTNVGIAIDGGVAGRSRLGFLPGGVDNGELGFKNNLQIGSISNSTLVMNNEWMRILGSNGYVGIGTTSPGARLHVVGHIWQTIPGNSTFFGTLAGANDNQSATNQNTYVGVRAGTANVNGTNNTAIGYNSGQTYTTGGHNTSVGALALAFSTGGNNTAVGSASMLSNAAGNMNTSLGWNSAYDNTSGNNNVAIGVFAGMVNTTGSNNTFLGYNAKPGAGYTNLTNAGAIGANATVNQSNSLILGNNANIGVGTSSPAAKMEVVGESRVSGNAGAFRVMDRTNAAVYYNISSSGGNFDIQYATFASNFRINGANTYLGQGFASSGTRLTVGVSGDGSNAIANSWAIFSDRRYKENIQSIENPISLIKSLNGVTYNWKKSGNKDIGFIAQDVESVLPTVVFTDEETGYKSMDYARMTPILIEAVKAQQEMIEDLKKKQEALEKEIEQLKNNK